MVISAIRACMEVDGLPEALRSGLDQFRLADHRARDLPDVRLDMLIEEGAELAQSITENIADQVAPADRDPACAASTAQPDDAADTGEDPKNSKIGRVIAERMCFDLVSGGAGTPGRAGPGLQRASASATGETVAAVHRLAPAARDVFSPAAG